MKKTDLIEHLVHLKDDEEILIAIGEDKHLVSVERLIVSLREKSNGEKIKYMVLYPYDKVV